MRILVVIIGALVGYLVATNLVWPILPEQPDYPALTVGVVVVAMIVGAVIALRLRRGAS